MRQMMMVVFLAAVAVAGCGNDSNSSGGSDKGPSFLDENPLFADACFGVVTQDFEESTEGGFGIEHAVGKGQKILLNRLSPFGKYGYTAVVANGAETGVDTFNIEEKYLEVDCDPAVYKGAVVPLRDQKFYKTKDYKEEVCALVKGAVVKGAGVGSTSSVMASGGDSYDMAMTFQGASVGDCPTGSELYFSGAAEEIEYSSTIAILGLHPVAKFYTK